jgi:hypothetical protein
MATRFYSSVEYGNARPSNDPDVLYFNATINNNNVVDSTPGTAPQVTASYQRTFPLIQDASDYMMSVVRMSTNGATRNLPILIPQIQGSTIEGTQWLGSVSANQMTINSTPTPSLAVGQKFSGSGTAILVSDTGARVGTIPYTILLGSDGNPITLKVAPPLPGGRVWGLSSNLAKGFWPGGNGFPGGLYNVSGISNGSFFIGSAQEDIDLTVYSFTIVPCVAGVPSGAPCQVFVEWDTQEPSARPPASPVITQELGNEYYYCYSYDWWLTLCNRALATAFSDAGLSGSPPRIFSNGQGLDFGGRVFQIDQGSNTIFAPGVEGDEGLVLDYRLYMNTNMANLFGNFPGTWDDESDGRSFQVYYTRNSTNNFFDSYSSLQEFCSTSSWTPVDALVLTTSALPIVAEQITPPSLVGASDTGFNRGVSESAFQSILLDTTLQKVEGAEDWRKNFIFEPTGEYRMVSLTTQTSPIANVDIFAWWRNRLDDGLYPLRLSNGSSLSVKLMFRRKQMGV